jgi:hypothetical protein
VGILPENVCPLSGKWETGSARGGFTPDTGRNFHLRQHYERLALGKLKN